MNDEVLNLQIRKFLKKVGVTSQREIERAIREAIAQGKIDGSETLTASVQLRLAPLDVDLTIEESIALE